MDYKKQAENSIDMLRRHQRIEAILAQAAIGIIAALLHLSETKSGLKT